MPSRQLWHIAAAIAALAVVMLVSLYVLGLFGAPPALERSPGPGAPYRRLSASSSRYDTGCPDLDRRA